MVVISGRSSRYSHGIVGMVSCSHAYPACYVARFIKVLDQCNTAGAVKTCSGCRPRLVADIIDCICSKNARLKRVQPVYFPADY